MEHFQQNSNVFWQSTANGEPVRYEKRHMNASSATTSVYYFNKTKGKGMLFVGPFVPLSQMATEAIEIMVNCLDFIVNGQK